MGDFQLSNECFEVKSTFGNYLVDFSSHKEFLDNTNHAKTILVIDKTIYKSFQSSFTSFLQKNILVIDSSEKSKSSMSFKDNYQKKAENIITRNF